MGYSTQFDGCFTTNKKVDEDTYKLLKGLATTRRMKRDMSKLFPEMKANELYEKFGTDGEFYIDGKGFAGQDYDDSIVDYNTPPSTQPGLWCQWIIDDDHETIEWDGGEKFYEYTEWITYIINSILKPLGYVLNGDVCWIGEDEEDKGQIIVKDNNVSVKYFN